MNSESPRTTPPSRYREEDEARPRATFTANANDLIALGALVSGLTLLLSCVTGDMFRCCLPLLPLLLGAIGLASARQAVDENRTRLWSWVGLGSGAIVVLFIALILLCTLVSFALMIALNG